MKTISKYVFGSLVIALLVIPGLVHAQDGSSESGQFTNEAGNPIMAGDLERVGDRATGDTPAWAEGHRWEPRRNDPHTLRKIIEQQRTRSERETDIPRVRYFLFLILVGALLVRALLGWIIYRDIQSSSHRMSVMWIPVVLLSGTLGAMAYGIFRISARDDRQ